MAIFLQRKQEVYQQVHELYAEGMSLRGIARHLGLARNTVRKYFQYLPEELPLPRQRQPRASQPDPYEDYLLSRWSQGCRNAALLYRELREKGFRGANSRVRAYIAHFRKSSANGSPPPPRTSRGKVVSPRVLRWLLARERDELDHDEQAQLDQLLASSEQVRLVYTLLQSFLSIVCERKHEQLRPWMGTKPGAVGLRNSKVSSAVLRGIMTRSKPHSVCLGARGSPRTKSTNGPLNS